MRSPPPNETRHLQLLGRLRDIFELHSPSSTVFEATWGEAQREDAQGATSAGPRWRTATFSRFLHSAGLARGHRASAVAAGLSRLDADLIFAAVCGKGGVMDLMDFAEALAQVARRLESQGSQGGGGSGGEKEQCASATELIERLLANYFTGSSVGTLPASARALTAARAVAAARAAARGYRRYLSRESRFEVITYCTSLRASHLA